MPAPRSCPTIGSMLRGNCHRNALRPIPGSPSGGVTPLPPECLSQQLADSTGLSCASSPTQDPENANEPIRRLQVRRLLVGWPQYLGVHWGCRARALSLLRRARRPAVANWGRSVRRRIEKNRAQRATFHGRGPFCLSLLWPFCSTRRAGTAKPKHKPRSLPDSNEGRGGTDRCCGQRAPGEGGPSQGGDSADSAGKGGTAGAGTGVPYLDDSLSQSSHAKAGGQTGSVCALGEPLFMNRRAAPMRTTLIAALLCAVSVLLPCAHRRPLTVSPMQRSDPWFGLRLRRGAGKA